MTLERDELALKAALDRRRPAALPPGLLRRLDAIPDEVVEQRPLFVRLVLGVAPWVTVAAAVLMVAGVSGLRPIPTTAPGATSGWSPATTGGIVDPGILQWPLVPLVLWFALLGALGTISHVRRGGTMRGAAGISGAVRAGFRGGARIHWTTRILLILVWFGPQLYTILWREWDPLVFTEPSAPGPEVSEVRNDAVLSISSENPDEHCYDGCGSHANFVYRVRPGQFYTWVFTVKNDGPLPVTVLGHPDTHITDGSVGLAILRDPGAASSDAASLEAFRPVSLAPGSAVTLAMVEGASSCADPGTHVPASPRGWGYPLVYEVAGWRRTGYVWPRFAVSVAGCGQQ